MLLSLVIVGMRRRKAWSFSTVYCCPCNCAHLQEKSLEFQHGVLLSLASCFARRILLDRYKERIGYQLGDPLVHSQVVFVSVFRIWIRIGSVFRSLVYTGIA